MGDVAEVPDVVPQGVEVDLCGTFGGSHPPYSASFRGGTDGLITLRGAGTIEDVFDPPTAATGCVLPDAAGRMCGSPTGGAPFPLCPAHVALVAEWSEAEWGSTDLLPSPCRACGSRIGVRYPSGWVCAACEWRVGDVLDDGLPAPRVDVVYYLRFRDRIKIGTTANPRQRLARIWHDEVLAFERGDRLVERRRHEQFAGSRLDRSEWFGVTLDLEEHIGRLAAGVDDPWAQYVRWLGEAAALRG